MTKKVSADEESHDQPEAVGLPFEDAAEMDKDHPVGHEDYARRETEQLGVALPPEPQKQHPLEPL